MTAQPAIAPPQVPDHQPDQPQANIESAWRYSEKSLIGCILQSGAGGRGRQTFAEAVDATGINYTDFFSRELSALWFVMARLYDDGADIDMSTVWAEVQKSEKAQKIINMGTLAYLAGQKVGGHRTHAENIVDASVSKSIQDAINQLAPVVSNPKIKASEKLRRVQGIVTELSTRTDHAMNSQTIKFAKGLSGFLDDYETAEENGDVLPAITTGFPSMDSKIDGWRDGTLHVIAGAPGSGKTVGLSTMALHAVMASKKVLFVQLELPLEQVYRRLLCAFAGIDSNNLKRHQLTGYEESRLPKALKMIREYDKDDHFTILTMNRPTLDDIEIKLDTLMMQGYDVIFFDYAGGARIAPAHPGMDDLKHHQDIYTKVDSWKKRYNVPVITGAQYSAPKPQKNPGTYTQDMVYSSSFIKHNADTITFLHPHKKEGDGKPQTSFVMVKIRDGQSDYGSNTIINVEPQMNMFRFVPKDTFGSGPPRPLWEIHEANKPASLDLGDL